MPPPHSPVFLPPSSPSINQSFVPSSIPFPYTNMNEHGFCTVINFLSEHKCTNDCHFYCNSVAQLSLAPSCHPCQARNPLAPSIAFYSSRSITSNITTSSSSRTTNSNKCSSIHPSPYKFAFANSSLCPCSIPFHSKRQPPFGPLTIPIHPFIHQIPSLCRSSSILLLLLEHAPPHRLYEWRYCCCRARSAICPPSSTSVLIIPSFIIAR